jgi:hypothetical protein
MRRDERSIPARSSMREILAAWAFCGLVGVGGLLADVGDADRDPGTAAYAGVHIPGRSGPSVPALSIEDEFAGNADDDIGAVSNSGEPPTYSSQEVAEYRRCWLGRIAHRLL